MNENILALISKYQEVIDHEVEIRNPDNMPDTYDRMRSLDRQWSYEKVIVDLKELINQ